MCLTRQPRLAATSHAGTPEPSRRVLGTRQLYAVLSQAALVDCFCTVRWQNPLSCKHSKLPLITPWHTQGRCHALHHSQHNTQLQFNAVAAPDNQDYMSCTVRQTLFGGLVVINELPATRKRGRQRQHGNILEVICGVS
jgi:hypothetical protein